MALNVVLVHLRYYSFKMADHLSELFVDCFADILGLLRFCGENDNCTSKPLIQSIISRLEVAEKLLEHILPVIGERKDKLGES